MRLAGVRNAVVTNEPPDRLWPNFSEYFDKILIDAPCSGEGMFRKDAEAVKSWGKFKTELCMKLQQEILEAAHRLIKPGGRLLYSTCTFDPREDEEMIRSFMEPPSGIFSRPACQAGRRGGRSERNAGGGTPVAS